MSSFLYFFALRRRLWLWEIIKGKESAAREGLIDIVIPTAHFGTTDDGCPVELWRRLLPPACRLAVGIETNILPHPRTPKCGTTRPSLCNAKAGQAKNTPRGVFYFDDIYFLANSFGEIPIYSLNWRLKK